MDEDVPVADYPLEQHQHGWATACAVVGLVVLVVTLVVGVAPLRVLLVFGGAVLIYAVGVALTRGPLSLDAGIPRARAPEHPDLRAAFRVGLRRGLVMCAVLTLVMGALCWLFDDWGMMSSVVPVILLFQAMETTRESRRLRDWQAAHGVCLHTRRGARPRGLRDPDGLVAVPADSPDLVSREKRS